MSPPSRVIRLLSGFHRHNLNQERTRLMVPATGKPVTMTGMTMVRIRNGKVVQGWDNWDQAAMMRQLAV
jgi:predicted ester cyclase